ncbi:TPA: hypothetical protein DDZ49_01490 [Candidatus Wolfebacteria bacterium]|uniref:Outer membrane protein beta-barrel domain-containing protein n=2 Tax=Candidatus Wolfeibacteriota TaxID=1752735 RepID=A0A0G1X5D0_9BACT|nr:MAG: hypothetical protein UX70_C0001G0781 [Candidatus Wolfebacteria bacterium GW2011_GWB1_47_1]KKU42296.1 MAG: hypothetical protein UX58_C0002G0010 [Candidatus Wolfebacteria bacterium GW2011_GWB2_46_69]KKU58943.1 MAG: hypothetical protein UX83_C0010G0065 [Candidatus Wolfebacteria bacterium GW2011_GWE2_47_12]KKU66093.1 MAG: hypothetical protein UX90_C0001G0152 [Candidatus Wolfebacteria bacterium GW2011_GWD2_47_17]KKU89605.1 MAG: hypothetical protein UY19_C0011G0010 [Candidatus Wolfebacteria b
MKRIVSLAVAIIVLVASVPVYAVTLATESGFYVGMKLQEERYMPTEKDAQPMHLTNYGPVIGYEYEPTVTRVEIQGFYTKLEIVDAVMPGMGLKDEKISGLGIELSQGVKLTDVGDLRVGGFLNYVYHFGLYSQDFVIPTQNGNYAFTLDIPRFHQLRTGGIAQIKPLDCLTVNVTGGYQLQGAFIGSGASLRIGSIEVGADYFHGMDGYDSYAVSTAIHF